MLYKTDIQIAREAKKRPIQEIVVKLGIPSDGLLPFGHDKAKVSTGFTQAQDGKKDGKLILVTAINSANVKSRATAICREIMTMAGLRWVPSAESIFINDEGQIDGLF
jgi:formyltetrahydrofolate synthetase